MNDPERATVGRLEGISIRTSPGGPVKILGELGCDQGVGLVGDYEAEAARAAGNLARKRQVTLIGTEALAHVERELGISFSHGMSRRNLLVSGLDLNALVGKEFEVGGVRMVGTSLCHPCDSLEAGTAPGVKDALKERGGLCAMVVKGGRVAKGMVVKAV